MEDHVINSRVDFDLAYTVFILKNSSPRSLEVNEHLFIQMLRTLENPNGINSCDPFSMPLLFDYKTFHPDSLL